ncbi:MAG: hypothetical protein QM788_04170 [Roseateles sp.]|uniref:hypothetical protein n=1 Tax=Roseateles sp. TaxID=1971397 RepID=UPI0039EA128D
MKAAFVLLLAASTAHAAQAQALEARRYRTSEGVEVLTGRPAPAASAPVAVSAAPAAAASPPGRPASPPQARQVPAAAQADRDRERFGILQAELMAEARSLSAKRLALASPRAGLDLTSEQLQALRDNIARHEENIRALNREIRRLPASAMSGPPPMPPKHLAAATEPARQAR